MKLGFFLGFLIGAVAASLLQAEPVEAPEDDAALLTAGRTPPGHPPSVGDALRAQFQEAREAAREAALEKEAEMLLEYDRTVHRKKDDAP